MRIPPVRFSSESSPDLGEYVLYCHPATGQTFVQSDFAQALIDGSVAIRSEDASSCMCELNGRQYFMVRSDVGHHGWYTICALSTDKVFQSIRSPSILMISALALYLFGMFIFLAGIHIRLLRPLSDAIRYLAENNIPQISLGHNKKGFPELNIIHDRFTSLMQRQQSMIESYEKVSSENRANKIKRLRMQLNPHFLYNTLNSIKILADSNQSEEVSRMIYNLTHLLQACLRERSASIPLHKELKTLTLYFDIERSVHKHMICFKTDLDVETLDCLVPNFILQPLVENAFQHGLVQEQEDAYVMVSSAIQDDCLILHIRNNGIGMTAERLEAVRNDMVYGQLDDHLGLKSVHQRIFLTYGEPYGITIDSAPEKGTDLTIRLPLLWPDEEGDDIHVSSYYR